MTRCGALFHGGSDPWRGLVHGPTAPRLCASGGSSACVAGGNACLPLWPPLNVCILSAFCRNQVFQSFMSEVPCFCPSKTPLVSLETIWSLRNCGSALDYSGNACRWIWQMGSVQIHSWLDKWLKAQRLNLCICFQCKADKSRADSDTGLPEEGERRHSRRRRLEPACCSFQRAVHMAHSSGSTETFKALLLKEQTFVLWQKLWPEVLL